MRSGLLSVRQSVRPCVVRLSVKASFRAPDSTQLNSTQLVELSRVGRSEHSDDPTQLNSTG